MGIWRKLFSRSRRKISSYADFWKWFEENERIFFEIVKRDEDIVESFLDCLGSKLEELRPGYCYLTGMYDTETAELIITADGVVKNIVYVEELVDAAPTLSRWKIAAHKQPLEAGEFGIEMDGVSFSKETMMFYSVKNSNMPDKIDLGIYP